MVTVSENTMSKKKSSPKSKSCKKKCGNKGCGLNKNTIKKCEKILPETQDVEIKVKRPENYFLRLIKKVFGYE